MKYLNKYGMHQVHVLKLCMHTSFHNSFIATNTIIIAAHDILQKQTAQCQCQRTTVRGHRCEGLKVWWEACEIAALVLLSSGTVERVFSLVDNMFGDKQGKMLENVIKLRLVLAFNKRSL